MWSYGYGFAFGSSLSFGVMFGVGYIARVKADAGAVVDESGTLISFSIF
jgi:hypothetical protein